MICNFRSKKQIPSTKLQINLKFQYTMTKTFKSCIHLEFRILIIGICLLFGIWDFNQQMNFNKANPFRVKIFAFDQQSTIINQQS